VKASNSLRKRDEARKQFRAALEHAVIKSQRVAANVSLGVVYSLSGESDLAEQHLREALRLDADNVPHWKILAEHLARNQQFEKARAAWREASRLAPDDPLIRSRLQALETQPTDPTEENDMRKS
jgi:Tfp pilus assembly protein PilF